MFNGYKTHLLVGALQPLAAHVYLCYALSQFACFLVCS